MGEEIEQIPGLTEDEETIVTNIVYIFDGITAPIVIILGLIGNFLTAVVLTRRSMHTSTNFFLTGLALWDSIVLLGSLCLMTLPQISKWYEMNAFPYVVVYIYPIALVAQTSTVWITVSFTVERYIAVCHPLRAATMCTLRRARTVILVVSICSLLFNICRWFEYKIDYTFNNRTLKAFSCQYTDLGKNEHYKMVYYSVLYSCVMLVVPLSILTILNTLLVLAVKKSQRQQLSMNVRQCRENNITIMLISIVVVFMICQVPALVYNFSYAIHTDKRKQFGWEVLSPLRNFLVTFNSAINFLLYCALGKKFRCVFFHTFCRCLLNKSQMYHGATHMFRQDINLSNSTYEQTHSYRYCPGTLRLHNSRTELQMNIYPNDLLTKSLRNAKFC